MSEVLYHFTSRFHLPKILKDRFLKITDSNLKEDDETYKMVVWLTCGANGDGCVLEHSQLNKKEIKITLNKREHYEPWILWSSNNRMNKSRIKVMTRGNLPYDWYVSEKNIPLNVDEVIKIENTVTGEVLADITAGVRKFQAEVFQPENMPDKVFIKFYEDYPLKLGDIVEFSI